MFEDNTQLFIKSPTILTSWHISVQSVTIKENPMILRLPTMPTGLTVNPTDASVVLPNDKIISRNGGEGDSWKAPGAGIQMNRKVRQRLLLSYELTETL